ncbi:hypothetical protein FoTM2_013467 [Fusarium oxysporum f. sp. vasinfectum]|nr:hypothetical protein FoTM2_013445 [Fusarium oxysporum f. sp. vasinfectum]KAK2926598.1 hypothetical protein FoTM2_013467 [Fusarium oxysporum f. sp. vasinfectum]
MPPGSPLFAEDVQYAEFSSPAPESSIAAIERPHSQRSIFSVPFSPTSSASTRRSQPKKRKLRTPETWKHFRVPQGDEETHQNNQRLWYCQHCHNPPWRTVSTTSAKRHMRKDHGIIIDDEERTAKKRLQQSLEVAFTRAEEKNRETVSRGEQSILRNTIQLDAFYEAQIQLITRRRLPLNCVSWPEYQALLCAINPMAEEILIQSGTTVLAHTEHSYVRLAGHALGIDNATRWNSWYMLLRTALEKRDKLMMFQQEHHKVLGEDSLTQDDWDVLRLTADFLQPFWQATLAQQKKWSSLDQLLYHMDILLKHFEDAKYKDIPVASTPEEPPEIQMTAYDKLAPLSLDVTEACGHEDELERFINGSPCKIAVSPLAWWTREEQRMEFPRLHKMAINVLSIAPMSDKAERVFSGARRTISFDRARLGAETIEMTECLGNWNKNDLIREVHVLCDDDN